MDEVWEPLELEAFVVVAAYQRERAMVEVKQMVNAVVVVAVVVVSNRLRSRSFLLLLLLLN